MPGHVFCSLDGFFRVNSMPKQVEYLKMYYLWFIEIHFHGETAGPWIGVNRKTSFWDNFNRNQI